MPTGVIEFKYMKETALPPCIIIKGANGFETKYVPEVAAPPKPQFEPGQIVEVLGHIESLKGKRGVVVEVEESTVRVEFGVIVGNNPRDTRRTFYYPNKSLALVGTSV